MCAELIVGGALAGAGLIGSAIASSEANETQRSENAKNRYYNAEEAEKNRVYSTNERLALQEYNTGERLAVQAYNSPGNQAALMRGAGLNPALNSGVSFAPAQAMSSGQGTSTPVASLSTGINPSIPNMPQLISSGSDLIKAYTQANTGRASIGLMNQQTEFYLQKTLGEAITNDLLELERAFKKETFSPRVKKEFEGLAKLMVEKSVAEKQGLKFDKESSLAEAQKRVQESIEKLNGEELIRAQFYNNHLSDILRADLKVKDSSAAKNYADANASNASAGKIYSEKEYQDMVNDIKRGSLSSELEAMLDNYAASSQKAQAEVEQFKDMFNRYRTLNKNNENGAADYINHMFWYVKEKMPSLPIVPFLRIGK